MLDTRKATAAFKRADEAFFSAATNMASALTAVGPDADRVREQAISQFTIAKGDLERATAAMNEAVAFEAAARQARSKKPTIAERAREGVCPNCGRPVSRRSPKGPPPEFCTDRPCKVEMFNRLAVEGAAIITFAKAWRIDRGSGEIATQALSEMSRILDGFNAADLAASRPRADYHAALKMSKGSHYFDRQRKGGR